MKVTLERGDLKIDLCALLERLSDEDKQKLVETLACESSIIRHVTDQILTGWTESGWTGSVGCSDLVDPAPCTGLDWAIRQVSLRSGPVAAKEIVRLAEALKRAEEQLEGLGEENRHLRLTGRTSFQ